MKRIIKILDFFKKHIWDSKRVKEFWAVLYNYWRKSKAKFITILKYANFYFNLYRISIRNRSINLFRKHIFTFQIFTLIYFFILLALTIYIGRFINIISLDKEKITYFVSSGAMIGGILAIVFTLIMFLMQNAAENTSAGFYETLGKDRIQDTIFFFITSSAVFFFVFGLTANKDLTIVIFKHQLNILDFMAQISIFLIGAILYFVFYLYRRVFVKIDPKSAIITIKKDSIKSLESMYVKAKEIATLIKKYPKTDNRLTYEMILANSFQSFKPDLYQINIRLSYLFDYHDKLIAKHENNTALLVLNIIIEIIEKYFDIRKNSSLIFPAGSDFLLATVSDSHDFLTPNLESLLTVGEEYMRNNNNVGIRKIISLIKQLASSATEIRYLSSRVAENPIAAQCRGYLDVLMKSAIALKHEEGLFQGAIAYGELGSLAVKNKLVTELSPIYKNLDLLLICAITSNLETVMSEVTKSYTKLLGDVLFSDFGIFNNILKRIIERIQKNTFYLFTFTNNRTSRDNYTTQTITILPFKTLETAIFQFASDAENATDRKQTQLQERFITTTEELKSCLRYLSDNMKSADHLLVHTLGEIIASVGCLILELTQNPKWTGMKRELISKAKWYIAQAKWFTANVPKIEDNLSFDSLVEAVTKMGIKALQVNQDEIAVEAIDIITKFAFEMFEKEEGDKYGLTEPRIIVCACYIGILASKLGKKQVVTDIKAKVKDFDAAYKKFWFPKPLPPGVNSSIYENQLEIETTNLVDEKKNLNRIYDLERAEDILLPLITVEDITDFIKEIW